MNTYTLTEIELQTKAKEFLSENNYRLWCILQGESLVEDVVNAMLAFNKLLSPPLPSGAKKEDIPKTFKELEAMNEVPPLPEAEDIQPVLRWVKAVKRLPNNFKKVCIKVDGNYGDGECGRYYELPEKRFVFPNGIVVKENEFNRIEWLEEIEQPVPQKEYNQFEEFYLENYISPDIDDAYLEGIKLMLSAIWLQLSPSKSSQKQSLIELMQDDQRDGIYGVSEKKRPFSDFKMDELMDFIHIGQPDFDAPYSEFEEALNDLRERGIDTFDFSDVPPAIVMKQVQFLIQKGFDVPMLNSEQEDKRSVATMPNSSTSPDPQNAQKEPVIDNLTEELINVRDFLYIIAREAKNRFPNDSLHLTIEGRIPQIENLLKRQ